MKYFLSGQWLFFSMIIGVLLLSFGCLLLITYYMQQMVKESDNLEDIKPKIMKNWIEEYIKEKQKITNTSVYINKKLQQMTIGKYKISRIRHWAGQLLLLAICMAGIGACKGIIDGKTLGQVLPFYIISLLGLYVYFSLAGMMDLEGRKKIILMNLLHYLENGNVSLYYLPEEKGSKEVETEGIFFGEDEDKVLREVIREILT